METLYDWLLYNTGNAGNYYTILNTQRNGADSLEVMARSSDFKVVNVFIYASKKPDLSAEAPDKASGSNYAFADEQQLIDFFVSGKAPESHLSDNATGIRVVVAEPDGATGAITFPTA